VPSLHRSPDLPAGGGFASARDEMDDSIVGDAYHPSIVAIRDDDAIGSHDDVFGIIDG
jgi:hypothetical protein